MRAMRATLQRWKRTFEAISEKIGVAQRQQDREYDGDEGQSPFDWAPAHRPLIRWRADREQDEAGGAGALRDGTGDILRQQGGRGVLQQCIIFKGLPGLNQMT